MKSNILKLIFFLLSLPIYSQNYNNEMLKNIGAIRVHQGEKPLNKSYNGKGVIVGIINSGIKWDHEDFKQINKSNKSKLLTIWDQTVSKGNKPENFSYGVEYKRKEINNALENSTCLQVKDNTGTGTHITGVAAGNLGVAPDADIIIVKKRSNKSSDLTDAVKYIFDIADKLNRPCVINLNYNYKSLDEDITATKKIIDEMIKGKPGRAFVTAAGNNGNKYSHMKVNAKPNTEQWSWLIPVSSSKNELAYVSKLYGKIKNEDLGKISVAFGIHNTTSVNDVTQPSSESSFLEYQTIDSGLKTISTCNNKNNPISKRGRFNITLSYNSSQKYSEFVIEIKEPFTLLQDDLKWFKLYVKGTGEIHFWNIEGKTMYNPKSINLTVDDNYIYPDNHNTISGLGNGKNIITVGAYINRTSWKNYSGTITDVSSKYKAGEFAFFSSQGSTIDGRIKPEISAPGGLVMSTLNKRNEKDDNRISKDGKHIIGSNTSVSAAVVTGAIALLLEKDPTLTNEEIRDILFANTDKDEFTGELETPDNKWGYGKLNIFKAISNISTDINENITSISHQFIYNVYPNPCDEYLQLKVNRNKNCNIEIYNTIGSLVYKQQLYKQQENIKINTNNWNSGLYLIKSYNGKAIEQTKFMKN